MRLRHGDAVERGFERNGLARLQHGASQRTGGGALTTWGDSHNRERLRACIGQRDRSLVADAWRHKAQVQYWRLNGDRRKRIDRAGRIDRGRSSGDWSGRCRYSQRLGQGFF